MSRLPVWNAAYTTHACGIGGSENIVYHGADGRKVVKVGVRFNTGRHTVDEWVME